MNRSFFLALNLILLLGLSINSKSHAGHVEEPTTNNGHDFVRIDFEIEPTLPSVAHNLSNYQFITEYDKDEDADFHLITPKFTGANNQIVSLSDIMPVRLWQGTEASNGIEIARFVLIGDEPIIERKSIATLKDSTNQAAYDIIAETTRMASTGTSIHPRSVVHKCSSEGCALGDSHSTFELFASTSMLDNNGAHWRQGTTLQETSDKRLTIRPAGNGFTKQLRLSHGKKQAEIQQAMILLGKERSTGQYTRVIVLIHVSQLMSAHQTEI